MRTICDACEGAPAVLFCAADEAALCDSCDEKVHMCNKLASRHVRVKLAEPNDVPLCDICENSPAFFYCEIDGSSLCLQCDVAVHVGGKRTHGRYLLLRQRVEFPDIKVNEVNLLTSEEQRVDLESSAFANGCLDARMIDLNARPELNLDQTSTTQGKEVTSGDDFK